MLGSSTRWLSQIDPARRELIAALVFLILLTLVGTFGYHHIESDLTLFDGLYMTFITLTTIGFEEIRPLSTTGRAFTIIIGVLGIGAVAFIATRTAQLVLTGQLIRNRHMESKISQLKDHYILCGFGTVGQNIAEELQSAGVNFVVVDLDESPVQHARKFGFLAIEGDAEDDEVLEFAQIRKARGLVLAISNDSANVFITLTARELNPSLFILVRCASHDNQRKLVRAGADRVVAANEIGANRMARVILRPHVEKFLSEVIRRDGLDLSFQEVSVRKGSGLIGQTLANSRIRNEYQTMVVGIVGDKTGEMVFNPDASTAIDDGDVLIVIGSNEDVRKLRKRAGDVTVG